MYRRDSVVGVRPFSRQQEGDEVIIGSTELSVFLAVPAEAAELLEHLAAGKSIGEVSDFYQAKYGEIPDLEDFLSLLEAKGIVAPISEIQNGSDGRVVTHPRPSTARYHFTNFPRSIAQRLFNRATP